MIEPPAVIPEIEPGEWVRPRHRNYFLQCCKCGLIHSMDFQVVTHRGRPAVEFRMRHLVESDTQETE